MIYLYSFLFCGFVCFIGQIILDNTKLTPGHITSLFVVVGSFLDVFNIYEDITSAVYDEEKNKTFVEVHLGEDWRFCP